MITVNVDDNNEISAVSCKLHSESLVEMAKLDAPLCLGWVLGAMMKCIAHSNWPGHALVETDAVLTSLKVHLPEFSLSDFQKLKNLPCLTSRGQFVIESLPGYVAHGPERRIQLGRLMTGWWTFGYFNSKQIVPDAAMVFSHIEKPSDQRAVVIPVVIPVVDLEFA